MQDLKKTDKVYVAVAFRDMNGKYARHAAVTLASVFANTTSSVCAYVLHDETLTKENRAKLAETATMHGKEIEFIDVSNAYLDNAKQIGKAKLEIVERTLGKGMLYRLLMDRVITASRVIYLDCDILVTRDISDLWQIDLEGKAIGCVRDFDEWEKIETGRPITQRMAKSRHFFGIKQGEYFNSGVLLMDLDIIRSHYNVAKDFVKFFNKYGAWSLLADQDFLNYIFRNDKKLLDKSFNITQNLNLSKKEVCDKIFHTLLAKPYEIYTRENVDDLYWHYLTKTSYCASQDELISIMCHELGAGRYTHRHSSACVKRLLGNLVKNIKESHLLLDIRAYYAIKKEKEAKL
ncbi:MAG: glycosyltransferase family 8 protein [Synergistaceae bacterium]|nr:glycosyltransferase family 8 protein [Synergistaceae bacterium]